MITVVYVCDRIKKDTVYHIFDIRLDGINVGECNLRVGGDLFYTGNVGYKIDPEYRNLGYATAAVTRLMDIAKNFCVDGLYICCSPENLPSRRVAEKLGAVYLGDFEIPEDHELYAYGKRTASRYCLKEKNDLK